MVKKITDTEDIIGLLIDILDTKNVSYDSVKLKLRESHYCIVCMQHYRNCICDDDDDESVSDTSSISVSDSLDTSSDDNTCTNSDSESSSE